MKKRRVGILAISLIAVASANFVSAESIDVTVRHAPYVISSVSSKSEKAWMRCRYCGSKTSYERKYKWDVYNHVWVEITPPESIPDVCRKCKPKVRDQQKLDQKERELDRKIEYERSRRRIKDKERKLERLRQESR